MGRFDRGMALVAIYAAVFPVVVTLVINRAHGRDFLVWLGSDNAAAWVQAVGSIVSILAGGWFVATQIRANRELEIERRKVEHDRGRERATEQIIFAVRKVRGWLHKARRIASEGRISGRQIEVVRDNIKSVRSFIDRIDVASLSKKQVSVALDIELQFDLICRVFDIYTESSHEKIVSYSSEKIDLLTKLGRKLRKLKLEGSDAVGTGTVVSQ